MDLVKIGKYIAGKRKDRRTAIRRLSVCGSDERRKI